MNEYFKVVLKHACRCCWLFSKNGPTLASFSFIFSLQKQTIQFLQQFNVKNVVSILYTVPGFELTTFQT